MSKTVASQDHEYLSITTDMAFILGGGLQTS